MVPIKPTDPRAEYDKASAAYEAAAMSGDPERIRAAYDPLIAAGERYARAMDRRLAPSFETVLSDWTQQVDPGGEVGRHELVPNALRFVFRSGAEDRLPKERNEEMSDQRSGRQSGPPCNSPLRTSHDAGSSPCEPVPAPGAPPAATCGCVWLDEGFVDTSGCRYHPLSCEAVHALTGRGCHHAPGHAGDHGYMQHVTWTEDNR